MMDSITNLKREDLMEGSPLASVDEAPVGDKDLPPGLVSAPDSLPDLSTASVGSGTASPKPNDNANNNVATKRKKNSSKGRHGDPRMHRAVAARLLNPELSLLESLLEGGFTFPEGTEGSGKSDRNIYDSDGVLLCQRKNQLSRRLRLAKKRQMARGEGGMGMGHQDNNDSRTIQNLLLNGQLPIVGGNQQVPMMRAPHQFGVGGTFFPNQVQVAQGNGHAPNLDSSNAQDDGSNPMNKQQAMMENSNNFDQYLQLAVGIRPEQLQALRYTGNMYQAFPPAAGANQFQRFAMPQLPQNFLGVIDPQTAGLNSGMNLQNVQMAPMVAIPACPPPGQPQMNADLSRLLLNRSMYINNGEAQEEQKS